MSKVMYVQSFIIKIKKRLSTQKVSLSENQIDRANKCLKFDDSVHLKCFLYITKYGY